MINIIPKVNRKRSENGTYSVCVKDLFYEETVLLTKEVYDLSPVAFLTTVCNNTIGQDGKKILDNHCKNGEESDCWVGVELDDNHLVQIERTGGTYHFKYDGMPISYGQAT